MRRRKGKGDSSQGPPPLERKRLERAARAWLGASTHHLGLLALSRILGCRQPDVRRISVPDSRLRDDRPRASAASGGRLRLIRATAIRKFQPWWPLTGCGRSETHAVPIREAAA